MGLMQLISNPVGTLIEMLYRLPAVVIALSFHEWGHAFSAYKLGDPTARNLGRMTVDPLKHIDPMGFICMMLFRFGWAKPVPINPRNFRNMWSGEIIVSLAGVSVNFLLANAGMIVFYLLFDVIGVTNGVAFTFLSVFVTLNLALMVFNLFPIPPLDGYHVFKNLLIKIIPPRFFWTYERYGSFLLIIAMLSGAFSGVLGFLLSGLLSGMTMFYDALFGLLA